MNAVVALAVITLAATSCGDDDDPAVDIVINAPTELTLGAGFEQTVSVDATGSNLASATIDISQNGTSVITDNISLSGDAADLDFSFTINQTGDFDVVITATDAAGTTSTANLTLTITCLPSPQFVDGSMVSVVVEAPNFTDGTIGLVGDITGWADGEDITLTRLGTSFCFAAMADPADLATGGFKFRLDGTWDKVEKAGDCSELDNRTSTSAAGDVLSLTIAEWRNSDQFGGTCPN